MTSTNFFVRTTLSAALAGLFACMRPAPNATGVEQQPVMRPERSLATQHTVPPGPNEIPAAESPDDPDSPGTTRTPPAAPALPMDTPDELATGAAADPSTAMLKVH